MHSSSHAAINVAGDERPEIKQCPIAVAKCPVMATLRHRSTGLGVEWRPDANFLPPIASSYRYLTSSSLRSCLVPCHTADPPTPRVHRSDVLPAAAARCLIGPRHPLPIPAARRKYHHTLSPLPTLPESLSTYTFRHIYRHPSSSRQESGDTCSR